MNNNNCHIPDLVQAFSHVENGGFNLVLNHSWLDLSLVCQSHKIDTIQPLLDILIKNQVIVTYILHISYHLFTYIVISIFHDDFLLQIL